ncbi:MAG: MFS transporter [Bacteroidota bacterium]
MASPNIALNQPKTLNGWAMFDWANSAFALVITVAVFPEYFNSQSNDVIKILGSSVPNTALFAYLVSGAYLLIALVSPWLSGIADAGGKRLWFLRFFTTMGAISCILLFFFQGMSTLWIGCICFVLAMIGFAGGLVFYNSFLPLIATPDLYDWISARGFALGFIGSVILLLFNLLMILYPSFFGLPEEGTLSVRIVFITVGVWWIGFAQIPFRRLPPDEKQEGQVSKMAKKGWQEIKAVWGEIKEYKQLKRFLVSFFFYSAGTQTILFLASTFASDELNFESQELILVILILQILAIAGAYGFAALSTRVGNRNSILTMLVIWLAICLTGYFVTGKAEFYGIAGAVGLVMGGIQSLSRSTYAKLIPSKDDVTSYYSFYDVVEKVAIVLGTASFGVLDAITGSMRVSLLMLAFFFIVGIIVLLSFRLPKLPAPDVELVD